ncbi:MAG: hypothetical protein ACYTEI_00855 [Planctomycetota bacterium]
MTRQLGDVLAVDDAVSVDIFRAALAWSKALDKLEQVVVVNNAITVEVPRARRGHGTHVEQHGDAVASLAAGFKRLTTGRTVIMAHRLVIVRHGEVGSVDPIQIGDSHGVRADSDAVGDRVRKGAVAMVEQHRNAFADETVARIIV